MRSPLISAGWLLEHHFDAGVRVLDARYRLGQDDFGLNAYRAAHISGACFVDLEKDLSAPVRPDRRGGRHPLPDADHLAAVFSRLGLRNSDHVIAYDDPSDGQGFYAPHLWWLLRYAGHDAVSVLDGGLPAWIAAGGKLETATPVFAASQFEVRPRTDMIVNADYVASLAAGSALIDSRAGARFRGEVEPLDWKAGHIPGAVNKDWSQGIAGGHWKNEPSRFDDVKGAPEIIVYCGSGVSAAGNMLALELAGIRDAKLYPGSWSDWISDPSRPIETGS